MKTFAFRADDGLAELIEALAEITEQSPSELARGAMRAHIKHMADTDPTFKRISQEILEKHLEENARITRENMGFDSGTDSANQEA